MALKRNRTHRDDALSRMDPTRFEMLLADHYRRQGYRVDHVGAQATGQRYDGGIDLKLRRDDAYIIVQCKRWNAHQVTHNHVHELLGIMVNEGATGAIVVTSGEFTRAAMDAAAKQGHVQLIDGEALRKMLNPLAMQSAARASMPSPAADEPLVFRSRRNKPTRSMAPKAIMLVAGIVGFLLLSLALSRLPALFGPHRAPAAYPPAPSLPVAERGSDIRRPQQAGQPVNPYATAAHIVAARAALLTGDTRAAEAHVRAMASDITRSARMPDVYRPIDHEAARALVRPLSGVRSAVWMDAANFIVMVDGQQHRSMDMIDQVCIALEPLGDTLAVVVNLQDATAKNGDDAMTLSRNCQLPEGQRAFMQAKRQVDVVAPAVREQFKRMQRR